VLWEIFALSGAITLLFGWWQRRRWRHDYLEAINRALHTTSPAESMAAAVTWRRLMAQTWPGTTAREVLRMYTAVALAGAEKHDHALAELDRIDVKLLGHDLLCLWLNSRAYNLAHLGRAEEALDAIGDAEEMRADDVTSPLFPHSAITGTRGIALFAAGQLEQAEACLRQAVAMDEGPEGETSVGAGADDVHRTQMIDRLQAERYWWLGRVATSRGDAAGARASLTRAAGYPRTLYGARAARELAGTGPNAPVRDDLT
jgi:tetratricopeptide (TPR) repeat protein